MSELSFRVGASPEPFVRTTGLANWNRFAAVNDEFIDFHMDDAAAKAIGMPGVFGMGNLRVSYLHDLLVDWLGDHGDIVELGCEFRGLNLAGDVLTCEATVEVVRPFGDGSAGAELADLRLGVRNQDGKDTTPGTATVVRFGSSGPVVPEEPAPRQASGEAAPGAYLTDATIERIGATLPAVTAPPIGANDIARWALATWWPKRPPRRFTDTAAAADSPWGGLVAPRDLDPFAWTRRRPIGGDWLWMPGIDAGTRVLNGGQRNWYGAPVRPGDVISATQRLVDVVERETKRGPMVFFTSESRWTNQDGATVRIGEATTIYW